MLRLPVGFLLRFVKGLLHFFLEGSLRFPCRLPVLYEKSLTLRRVAVHYLEEGFHEQFQLLGQFTVAVALCLPASLLYLLPGFGYDPLSHICV